MGGTSITGGTSTIGGTATSDITTTGAISTAIGATGMGTMATGMGEEGQTMISCIGQVPEDNSSAFTMVLASQ